MKEAVVRARVEPRLKEEAEHIFECLGISTTDAIRMFLTQVKLRRGLPFVLELPGDSDLLLPPSSRQAALDSFHED